MTRLLTTLAFGLFIVPQAVRCEGMVKGKDGSVTVYPDYPYAARAKHLEGSGLYRVNVKPDGTVSSVIVLKSAGHTILDKAAVHALRQWRFKPGAFLFAKIPMTFSVKGVRY